MRNLDEEYLDKLMETGNEFYSSKQYEDALKIYEVIISINPEYYKAYCGIANILTVQGEKEKATEFYDKSISLNPYGEDVSKKRDLETDYSDTYVYKGLALCGLERYDEAIQSFDEALKIDPQKNYVYCYKGNVLMDLKMYDEAVEAYVKLLEIDPKNKEAYYFKGRSLNELKRYSDAIKNYDNALEIDPNYESAKNGKSVALYMLGDQLYSLKNYEEAIKCFFGAFTIKPDFDDAYVFKGMAYYELGNCNNAIRSYDEALKINPQNTKAFHNKGNAFYKLKNYCEALVNYNQGLEIDPNNYIALYNCALCCEKLNKNDKAIEYCENVLKIIPNDKDTLNLKNRISDKINKNQLTVQNSNYKPVVKEETEIVKITNNNSLTTEEKALIEFQQKIKTVDARLLYDYGFSLGQHAEYNLINTKYFTTQYICAIFPMIDSKLTRENVIDFIFSIFSEKKNEMEDLIKNIDIINSVSYKDYFNNILIQLPNVLYQNILDGYNSAMNKYPNQSNIIRNYLPQSQLIYHFKQCLNNSLVPLFNISSNIERINNRLGDVIRQLDDSYTNLQTMRTGVGLGSMSGHILGIFGLGGVGGAVGMGVGALIGNYINKERREKLIEEIKHLVKDLNSQYEILSKSVIYPSNEFLQVYEDFHHKMLDNEKRMYNDLNVRGFNGKETLEYIYSIRNQYYYNMLNEGYDSIFGSFKSLFDNITNSNKNTKGILSSAVDFISVTFFGSKLIDQYSRMNKWICNKGQKIRI